MIFDINGLTIIVMAIVGALCAYVANQNIGVFHDGLRPLYSQYFNGSMDRKILFATSFSLSFGLIVGFGLPTSVAGKIILIHTVLLATDIIGTAFNDDKIGSILSIIVGGIFGILLLFGMQTIMQLFSYLPIDFTRNLSKVGDLIIIAFCVFPALAVAYQCGFSKGVIVFLITVMTKQVVSVKGTLSVGGVNITLSADGMALLVSIVLMVFFAARSSGKDKGNFGSAFAVFEKNIERIRKNIIILSLCGGILALATTLLIVAEGPASLTLMREGQYLEAAMVAFGRTLGFIPLVMTTAIISGVYSPSGTKAIHVPALLLVNLGIIGLVGSFVIGCLIMIIEVLLLGFIAKGMDKFPGMKELGDNTRTAMSKVLELALLVGGMLAANEMAPNIGYVWVIGIYFLNSTSKKPISTMAVGPLGAISMGIIINILYIIGLFPMVG